MTFNIISMGKLKEDYFKLASAEYEKRIKPYAKLCVTELAPERLAENPSPAQIENALHKEAARILEKIPQSAFVCSLCIEGKPVSSEDFAEILEKKAFLEGRDVYFVIGSSFGLAEKVKRVSDVCVSFSRMTYPHRLVRIMLLEQVYRAMSIIGGKKYHK